MENTVFSKLEFENTMEKEIEQLKEKIAFLEQQNNELNQINKLHEQKDFERTKLNMDAECACVYTNSSIGVYLYGEFEQLTKMLDYCKDIKHSRNTDHLGPYIIFESVASAKTCLLRNGYKYSHESKVYHKDMATLYFENWIRGV